MDFVPYPKTPRLKRDIIITEKIDGTNAQIVIRREETGVGIGNAIVTHTSDGFFSIRAGSRNRWITPEDDNYGFAGWVQRNADDLITLGEGQHFGEWWGLGIQRGYNQDRKRFSLFNTARWGKHNPSTPASCDVVPVLAHTQLDGVQEALTRLKLYGSVAAPGWFNPEGIIVYHSAAKQSFKVLLENDAMPKGKAEPKVVKAAPYFADETVSQ
jgi:hypothetical protein